MDAERISTEQPNFFVTGLPRSRTAWFARYLPNCLHEGIEGCSTHKEFIKKLGNKGNSDSGLMFFPVERYFPSAPVVIVERDFEEVIQSLTNVGLFNDDAYVVLKETKSRLDKMSGMRVPFHNLPLQAIWEYLIGTEFDDEESRRIDNMNVQHINYSPDVQAYVSFIGGS